LATLKVGFLMQSNIQQIIKMAKIVQAVIDRSWMPEGANYTAFGIYDFWLYEDENAESECSYCKTYSGQLFAGNQLRTVFPDLDVITEDLILPNVHMTLWETNTCRCKLTRVPFNDLPEDWTVYSGEKTPHYLESGNYSYK
jgi:hypothetical protein